MINYYEFNTKNNFMLSFQIRELKNLNKIRNKFIINLIIYVLVYQLKHVITIIYLKLKRNLTQTNSKCLIK